MIIRQLPFFVAAADEEHIQRAARRLNLSQSALSRRIHELEAELGVQLFKRVGNGVQLTPLGRVFREDARRIVQDAERAVKRIRRLASGASGLLRVAFNENAARHGIVTDAFQRFRSSHPEAELRLLPMSSDEQIAALRSGQIDAGLVYHSRDDSSDLEHLEVTSDDCFVLALSKDHPLAQREDLRLGHLRDEDFSWPSAIPASSIYARVNAACELVQFRPRVIVESRSTDNTLTFAAAGISIGFVPLALKDYLPPGVVLRHVLDLVVPLPLDLVWTRGDASPALAAFAQIITDLQGAPKATLNKPQASVRDQHWPSGRGWDDSLGKTGGLRSWPINALPRLPTAPPTTRPSSRRSRRPTSPVSEPRSTSSLAIRNSAR